MRSFIVFMLLGIALLHGGSINNKDFGSATVAEVTSIYDGDTFRANIAGFPPIVGERMGVRVAGIDTAEMKGKCSQEKQLAREAKQFAVAMLRGGQHIELRHMKRGKYFRVVAEVYVDGRSLSDALIAKGLAVRYDGGKKTHDWCR
ncbi:thermonuclease family protein [Thiomicrolovo sp. ZZH C-3]